MGVDVAVRPRSDLQTRLLELCAGSRHSGSLGGEREERERDGEGERERKHKAERETEREGERGEV